MEKAMKYYLFLYFTYILFYSLYKTIPKQKLINKKIVGFLVIFLIIIPSTNNTIEPFDRSNCTQHKLSS